MVTIKRDFDIATDTIDYQNKNVIRQKNMALLALSNDCLLEMELSNSLQLSTNAMVSPHPAVDASRPEPIKTLAICQASLNHRDWSEFVKFAFAPGVSWE